MFPRVSRVKTGDRTYEYLRLVKAVRDQEGRPKQQVVANLGRLDLLGDELDELVLKLRRFCKVRLVLPNEIAGQQAVPWGPILVIRRIWEELRLDLTVRRLCQGKRTFDVAERAFVLVANRLCAPKSEHGLARWLENYYVCDSRGRAYVPDWLPVEEVTKEQRVKVRWPWLDGWYRTLDALYARKPEIENALYLQLRDLFHLQVDVVFYDLTTVYFERRQPRGMLRRHGANKDGKPRNVQVLLGAVMVDGFPICTHVFEGNRSEKKTVRDILSELRGRYEIKDVIFVADSGMQSPENRKLVEGLKGYSYLWGHKSRRSDEARGWLGRVGDRWLECGRGTRAQEVESGREGQRVFVVQSDERGSYEQALREKSMARAAAHLEKVAAAVKNGRLKNPEKIGARAARALQKDHGHRYYLWSCEGSGHFRYAIDERKMAAEKQREGMYLLTTNHPTLEPAEAVARYKELSDVEDGFRGIKDLVQGRPVHHKSDNRVSAHLFVAQLSLIVLRHLRRRLEQAGESMSAQDALEAVKSLGVSVLDLNGERLVLASNPKRDAKRVLTALHIRDTQPPGTTRNCKQKET